jgi:LDH2 family malate/lactate/ureidoglycolate dehydrogenase
MEPMFIPLPIVEEFVFKVLSRAGVPGDDAKIVTDVLIQADRFGFDSHGVNRLNPFILIG